MFQVRPDGDHRNQVQESPIWKPEPPDPGEVQVDHSHKVPVTRRWQQDSPSPGEAQEANSHQIQVRTI